MILYKLPSASSKIPLQHIINLYPSLELFNIYMFAGEHFNTAFELVRKSNGNMISDQNTLYVGVKAYDGNISVRRQVFSKTP